MVSRRVCSPSECFNSDMWARYVSRLCVLLVCSAVQSWQSCLLPPHPQNGHHSPLEVDCPPVDQSSPECRGVPGKTVDEGWLLVVTCNEGYTPSVPDPLDNPSVCENGDWSPSLPECNGNSTSSSGGCVLPPQPSMGKYTLARGKCGLRSDQVGDPGVSVSAECELRYSCDDGHHINDVNNEKVVCSDAKWSPSPFNIACKPMSEDDGGCVLPRWPAHGRFEPVSDSCGKNQNDSDAMWVEGTPVLSACVILFSCDEGYQLKEENDQAFSICENSVWAPQPSLMKCEKPAPAAAAVRPPGSTIPIGCLLPSEADNRRYLPWVPSTDTSKLVFHAPGAEITQAVKVQCDPGYSLPDNKEFTPIVCLNSNWIPAEIPECLKLCPALESDSMYIYCKYGSKTMNCSRPLLPHTKVTYQCRPSYREHSCLTKDGVYKRSLTCKSNGKWSHVLPECRPVCGLSRGDDVIAPSIIDGEPAKLGQFPWHAGLYMPGGTDEPQWKYICGGSLISTRIVLTAAHCVSQLESENLRVTLGKYYRSWDADGDQYGKRLNVSKIRIPHEYKSAATNYAFDIALLLLSESLEFDSFIMPVCMDINRDFDITGNTESYVVGWGETELGGKRAESLLYSKLDVSEARKCISILPGVLSFDKFCGNKNSMSVVEKGDSGGGLTAVFNGVHYIFGIVSLKYRTVSVFTNVTWNPHKSWLSTEIEFLNDS